MNLNEIMMNRGRGRGKRYVRNKNYTGKVTDMGPPLSVPVAKKDYNTPSSSDLNWGKSHISVANTSSTHKSASSSKISSDEDSRIIVALTEGRGEARCEVGIAAINVSKPLLILCQISDTQSYINTLTKINIFNPQEILVPLTFVENFSGNRLIDIVKERFPRIKYTGCARSTFNKTNGMDILSNLCIPSLNAILLVLEHRYYALAATSALITYVQDNLFVYYAAESIKIDYQESEGYAIIDVSTADRLELVCSAKPAQGNKYSSLFGVLNHCVTKIGSRTLRSCILQPPCKVQYIEERLDAIAELIKHPEMLLSIQALLQKVSNIELLLTISTLVPDDPQRCSNRQLNYILLLNTLIDLITPLREVLTKSTHPFFVQMMNTLSCDDFSAIKEIVRSTVQENAYPAKGEAAVMQRCFAIKAGINGLLDLVRKTYSERVDDMTEYVKRLAEKYDLALTLGNNQTKGHHIVLNLNQKQKRYMKKSDLPEEFIEVYRLAGSFTMKTPEIVNISTRLDDIMADILRISNVMVHSIIIQIKKYIPLFYKLCEEIAHLDVLQSLAECSVRNGYVRPKFGDFTEITFAHHPLLDFLLSTRPVANPICCSSDYNLHIITGPNGSGKSIFIRQVLLLQIMAQVGCYIPAQTAIFRPADRMYARIYLEDNMEHGASSFILEMKEIKYIMTTMTKNSLVIIDELCRSTSLEEGTALAIAIVEKLVQSSAFIYITTHFTLLTKLYEMYLNVKVWQLETIPSGEDPKTFKLDFKHNLIPGVTSVKRYGVYIVRNIWPDNMLKYVDALLDNISKKPKNANIITLDAKVRLKYAIESQFRKLKSQQKLTIAEVNKMLNQYHNELEKLGYHINVIPLASSFTQNNVQNIAQITHSVFGDIQKEYSIEEDLQATDVRLQENFTPQPSLSSQLSINLGTQQTEKRMQEVFTPEPSQQREYRNSLNKSCPNLDFYHNYQNKNGNDEYQNNSDGSIFQNYEGGNELSDSYQNVSRFIAEHSENIHKLIPEVNLSYEEISNLSQNSFIINQTSFDSQNALQRAKNIPESGNSKQSSIEISKHLDDFQFSLPLQNNATKTSTPVIHGKSALLQSPSKVVQIYNDRRNFSKSSSTKDSNQFHENSRTFIPKELELEGFDLESIQEELEVCSQIFCEEDNDFEESLNTTYKSLPDNYSPVAEKIEQKPPKEKLQHVMPIVTVIEGPNNTTLSFDENDFKDKPEDAEIKTMLTHNKINIISDIVIQPTDVVKPRIQQEVDTKKGESTLGKRTDNQFNFQTRFESHKSACDRLTADQSDINWFVSNNEDNANHEDGITIQKIANRGSSHSLEEIRETLERPHMSFESAYEDEHSSNVEQSDNSFKSCVEEHGDSLHSFHYSCKEEQSANESIRENILDLDKHKFVSNGYEVTLIEDPSKFVDSSIDNTIHREKSVEKNKKIEISNSSENIEQVKSNEIVSSEYKNKSQHEKSSSTNIVNKTALTSISYASKVRQLDQNSSDSSPEEENSAKKTSCDKTITSISSASRKRNLDQVTTDSTSPKEESSSRTKESSSSVKESDEDKSKPKVALKRKFFKSCTEQVPNDSDSKDSLEKKRKMKKCAVKRKKFIPPRKLSAKEIREEFKEQDRKIFESSPNSSNFSKYLEQLIKRPTVKQIQETTHLAMVRKTNEGVEIIPAKPPRKKIKTSHLKKHYSNENFSVSIFSDKNALPFESYLNSSEKDYKTFSFNFQKSQEADQKLGFEPTTLSFGEYTNNSVTKRFVRTMSETICNQQGANAFEMKNIDGNQDSSIFVSQPSANHTLTPDGFYKQNKNDISRILRKYLSGTYEGKSSAANIHSRRSIFESDIDGSDLNI